MENMRDTIVVRGYQVDDNDRKDFQVEPVEGSKPNEVRYGPLVGTFQVTVFHGKGDKTDPEPTPPPAPALKDDEQAIAAISRGTLRVGKIPQGELRALQAELRNRIRDTGSGRGLIGAADETKSNAVQRVKFVPDPPIPVMSYRIRYYQAGNSK